MSKADSMAWASRRRRLGAVGVPGGLVVAGRGAAVGGFGRGDRGRLVVGDLAPAHLGGAEPGYGAGEVRRRLSRGPGRRA